MKNEKLKYYQEVYNKPTLWYKIKEEYIDYKDENFWKLFNFVIQRLKMNYEEELMNINAPSHISEIPIHYRTLELCLLTITLKPQTALKYIPDEIKTKEMCEIAFYANPKSNFKYIPDKFKTEKMCEEALIANPKNIHFIPNTYLKEKTFENNTKKFDIK